MEEKEKVESRKLKAEKAGQSARDGLDLAVTHSQRTANRPPGR